MVGISLWLGAGELCGIVPRLSSCQPVSRLLRITVLWLAGFVLGFGPLYAWNLNRHVTRVLSSADGGNVELRARDFQLLPYAKQSVGAVRRIFAQARIDAKTDGQLLVATTRRVDVPPDTQIEGTIDGDDVYFTHSVRIAGNVISSWSPDSDFQMSLPAREFPILLVNGLQSRLFTLSSQYMGTFLISVNLMFLEVIIDTDAAADSATASAAADLPPPLVKLQWKR